MAPVLQPYTAANNRLRQPARCHPDRWHEARGLCRACYRRQHYHGVEKPAVVARLRAHGRLLPDDVPTLTPTALKAWRLAHGWSHRQCATAVGYTPGAWTNWEHGSFRLPPEVVLYVQANPPHPPRQSYRVSGPGLRAALGRKRLHVLDFADYCGVSEPTINRWLNGRTPLPPPVQAWLRAGAPHDWRWAPEGQPNVCSLKRKPVGSTPTHRRQGQYRWRSLPSLLPDPAKGRRRPDHDPPPCVTCGRPTKWGYRRKGECPPCAQRRLNAQCQDRSA